MATHYPSTSSPQIILFLKGLENQSLLLQCTQLVVRIMSCVTITCSLLVLPKELKIRIDYNMPECIWVYLRELVLEQEIFGSLSMQQHAEAAASRRMSSPAQSCMSTPWKGEGREDKEMARMQMLASLQRGQCKEEKHLDLPHVTGSCCYLSIASSQEASKAQHCSYSARKLAGELGTDPTRSLAYSTPTGLEGLFLPTATNLIPTSEGRE